jgi:hypothetical protein
MSGDFGANGVHQLDLGRLGGGWQVFVRTKEGKPVLKDQMYGRFPDPEHKQNFLEYIRTRQRPNADIAEGHRSTLLVHYANISHRLEGQRLKIDPKTERITNSEEASKLFSREYRKP